MKIAVFWRKWTEICASHRHKALWKRAPSKFAFLFQVLPFKGVVKCTDKIEFGAEGMQNARTIQRKTRNHQSRSCFRKNIARRATRPSRDRKMDPFSAAGCSTFLRQSERNPLFHPQKANRRAPSSRARDDAKRIFRFERRDVNKNAFTHRATRKRERLHVVLNATTRRVSSSAVLFSLSSVGCALFFFSSSFSHKRADVDLLRRKNNKSAIIDFCERERERERETNEKKINTTCKDSIRERKNATTKESALGGGAKKNGSTKMKTWSFVIMIRETFCTKIIYITL